MSPPPADVTGPTLGAYFEGISRFMRLMSHDNDTHTHTKHTNTNTHINTIERPFLSFNRQTHIVLNALTFSIHEEAGDL